MPFASRIDGSFRSIPPSASLPYQKHEPTRTAFGPLPRKQASKSKSNSKSHTHTSFGPINDGAPNGILLPTRESIFRSLLTSQNREIYQTIKTHENPVNNNTTTNESN
mmetsp:Transcript_10469/g.22045  ORF Transcript_10469/g.22045 Transcript_10469/m.22045 type:complete len:108 (+) Transcript_10469:838-1161(+)